MTELGIFARVFPSGSPPEVANAIRGAGFTVTQLNLSALGRPTLDRTLGDADAASVAAAFGHAGVRIWGLSGTFNAIDPDADARAAATEACRTIISRAPAMGAEVVTLSSGTRDSHSIWRGHPDNDQPAAWHDLRATLDRLIPVAARAAVRLGIEPEPGNVVKDAPAAARLLSELGDDARHIAIVLDPANLLTPHTLDRQERILARAFDLLGERVAALHAKDVVANGSAAAGRGGMDYGIVTRLHAGLPRDVPIIAQDLAPEDAGRVHDFLTAHLSRLERAEGVSPDGATAQRIPPSGRRSDRPPRVRRERSGRP